MCMFLQCPRFAYNLDNDKGFFCIFLMRTPGKINMEPEIGTLDD